MKVYNIFRRFLGGLFILNAQLPLKAVVFDIDDTLYLEKDYIFNGFSALCETLNHLGISAHAEDMVSFFKNNASDAISQYLASINAYSETLHHALLEFHRHRIPHIKPFEGVETLLSFLKAKGILLGVISDGTPYAQHNKLIGLNLHHYFDVAVFSDALGGKHCRKPCDVSFRVMQQKLGIPFAQMLYIGDNFDKDFYPVEHLGMQGIQFAHPQGIYFGKKYKNTISSYTTLLEILQQSLRG